MCIVALAWQVIDEMPLCLISNRDEFYHRPASQLGIWQDSTIVAGQDLQSGGTWLGVTAQGRWAVITNFRDGEDKRVYPTSRGHILRAFLTSKLSPIRFAQDLEKNQCDYSGFNLFVGDQHQAVYMSNRGEAPQVLAKGVYVVSNGLLSEHWEKAAHLRKRFTQEFLPMLQQPSKEDALEYTVWEMLEDQRQRAPEQLPDTGIALEMELLLSSTFIQSPIYGTRCSNFLRLFNDKIIWLEKTQQGLNQGKIVHQQLLIT